MIKKFCLFYIRWLFNHPTVTCGYLKKKCFFFSFSGSFIFLAIEGGASQMHQRTLASTNRQIKQQTRNDNNFTAISKNLLQETFEARQRTVENIWDVTVSLNILYRENWTR